MTALNDLQHELMGLINQDILNRDDVNSVDHKLTVQEEGLILGSIHVCVNQTEVRIRRVLRLNENPKAIAQEIHDEILKRLKKRAWEKLRRSTY